MKQVFNPYEVVSKVVGTLASLQMYSDSTWQQDFLNLN